MKACIPNALSILRIACIPLLFFATPSWRLLLLGIIEASDFLDGFLARRWGVTSQFGAIIDPVGDKGVVMALSYIYWNESVLTGGDLLVIFVRDIEVALFSIWLFLSGRWATWKIQSFWCGKAATALQGAMFFCIICGYPIPFLMTGAMIVIGIFAPFELYSLSQTLNQYGRKIC